MSEVNTAPRKRAAVKMWNIRSHYCMYHYMYYLAPDPHYLSMVPSQPETFRLNSPSHHRRPPTPPVPSPSGVGHLFNHWARKSPPLPVGDIFHHPSWISPVSLLWTILQWDWKWAILWEKKCFYEFEGNVDRVGVDTLQSTSWPWPWTCNVFGVEIRARRGLHDLAINSRR